MSASRSYYESEKRERKRERGRAREGHRESVRERERERERERRLPLPPAAAVPASDWRIILRIYIKTQKTKNKKQRKQHGS